MPGSNFCAGLISEADKSDLMVMEETKLGMPSVKAGIKSGEFSVFVATLVKERSTH